MKIKNQWDLKRNIKTERERKENQRGNWPVICVYEAVNGFPRWTGAIFHLNPLRSPTFLRRSNAWDLTHREVLELCRNFVDAGASRMFWSWSKQDVLELKQKGRGVSSRKLWSFVLFGWEPLLKLPYSNRVFLLVGDKRLFGTELTLELLCQPMKT